MPETNGNEWRAYIESRLAEIEKDNKILLRAQVLQGDKLSDHDAALTRIEKSLEAAIKRQDGTDERMNRMDERVDKLVSAIGELVRRMGAPHA